MILFINASQPQAVLKLISEQSEKNLKFTSQKLSESLLPQIQKLLQRNHWNLSDIKKIAVVTGPGPFSRMRTAVVTANALAYALNIAVAGIRAGGSLEKLKWRQSIRPYYDRPVNITAPKS